MLLSDFFYLHKMKFGHQIKMIHLMLRSKLGKVKFETKQSNIPQKGDFLDLCSNKPNE